jgi:hypothetical protein
MKRMGKRQSKNKFAAYIEGRSWCIDEPPVLSHDLCIKEMVPGFGGSFGICFIHINELFATHIALYHKRGKI